MHFRFGHAHCQRQSHKRQHHKSMVMTHIRNDQKLKVPILSATLVNAKSTSTRLRTANSGTARTRACFMRFTFLMNLESSSHIPQNNAYGSAEAITVADAARKSSRVNTQMGKTLSP